MTPTEEIIRTASVPVDVLRITPLRNRIPQHDQATVWHLHDRASLAMLDRFALPAFGSSAPPLLRSERRGVLAGLLTGEDFNCTEATGYLDGLLDRHRADGMAVETWGEIYATGQPSREPPHWWYVLLPVLVRLPHGPEDWPPEEPADITVRLAGEVHPNPAHTFPAPRPYPGPPRPLDAGTYVRQAATRTPPPPAPHLP
ncbi:hypothetical protein [Streptomyces collinus]